MKSFYEVHVRTQERLVKWFVCLVYAFQTIQKPIMQLCAFQQPAEGIRSVNKENDAAGSALAKSVCKDAFVVA